MMTKVPPPVLLEKLRHLFQVMMRQLGYQQLAGEVVVVYKMKLFALVVEEVAAVAPRLQ